MTESLESLEELIAEQKRLVAREYLLEAWRAAQEDGIETELLAETFARQLLMQLTLLKGSQAVTFLLADLKALDERGEFLPTKTLQ